MDPRLPRGHYHLRQPLNILLRCVERMPATGRLFTAQSPLGPIFIAGLIAIEDRDRLVVRNWFDTVTSRGSKSVSHDHSRLILFSESHTECPSIVGPVTRNMAMAGFKPYLDARS
jgi:Fungal specific transcription factor domain